MIAHVNAEVPRHAIEQAVPGIEPLANLLPEHKGSKKDLKLVKVVIAQTAHRLVERQFAKARGRELRPDWLYREAKEGEQGGVLINVSPNGRVDIRENLVKRDIDQHTVEETANNPLAPRKVKAAYSSVLCAYIAHHKTAAVQEMLFACPRKAKEVAVVARLGKFRPHEAMAALAREAEPQRAYAVLEGQVRQFAATLGFGCPSSEFLRQRAS